MADEYIKRESLIAWLHNMAVSPAIIGAIENKERFPAADVVEVVHGTWEIRNFIDNIGYRCSACNLTSDCDTPYCPLCGAKMDGDKNG